METNQMTIIQHKDFLANIRAQRIEMDQQIADARADTRAILLELRAFDIETNNAFNNQKRGA
tara:strand:- start:575 stop:760 length:186 start_codon:yes stop_codon:yes gene_type:complete